MIDMNDVMECVGMSLGNGANMSAHLKKYGLPYFNYKTGELGLFKFDGEHYHINKIIPSTYHIYQCYLPVYDAHTREYMNEWR